MAKLSQQQMSELTELCREIGLSDAKAAELADYGVTPDLMRKEIGRFRAKAQMEPKRQELAQAGPINSARREPMAEPESEGLDPASIYAAREAAAKGVGDG